MRTSKKLAFRGVAVAGAISLTLAACADGDDEPAVDPDDPVCDQYADYQGHEGETVNIYAPIVEADADSLVESWQEFEACTGIEIAYEGTTEFEAQIRVRVQGGNPPDLALIPQPGLIQELVDGGYPLEAPESVATLAQENWSEEWLDYTTIDGAFYGAPMGANVKSFVWYSPGQFSDNGWEVPETWDDLLALSDQIADTDQKPWCAGFGSGDATGWPGTDWIEDILLRSAGPEFYDQWWTHEVPFNSPEVTEAFDLAGEILKNEDYVNGGFNGPESIATTPFEDGGLPILDGTCSLHRQASFYANNFPDGTTVAEDGDVFAFYFPAMEANGDRPVLGAGEFVIGFSDEPVVVAVQEYLASVLWATSRAELDNWVSANQNVDINSFSNPIDRLSVEILQDPDAVFRFDASDIMPGAVGAGSFWAQITEWVVGQDSQTTVDNIESSWP